ncbi:MAG: hypothetical protein Ct9H90mP9_0270 [Pseudomonadota bacterium]|nr:MAG: hypothetical protein Ct9H90mP9_0270 [Pseudomonadota bacterium]
MIPFPHGRIGIRDDMYLGAGNAYMQEVAEPLLILGEQMGCSTNARWWSTSSAIWIILPNRWRIFSPFVQTYGSLENLKGKKIAMTWAYSPS